MLNRKLPGLILAVCAFILGLAHTTAAQADDRCRDVLRDGVFATMKYEEKSYFQQIVWSRFLSASYAQSKTDRSLGFTVPIGEIVMGGDYTEAQFKAKQQQIRDEKFQHIEQSNFINTFHSLGDPTIIKEWGECMRDRGGLSLTFKKNSPTEVTAVLEWHATGGNTHTRLTENTNLPRGAVFTNGARPRCFRAREILRASVPCLIAITLPNALQTLQWGITTSNGSASAYLPPRIHLRQEKRFYPIPTTREFSLYMAKKRASEKRQKTVLMSDEELSEGWTFDSNTARVNLRDLRTLDNNFCNLTGHTADAYSFTYGLLVAGRTWGKGKNSTAVCQVEPSIMMIRNVWVPDEVAIKSRKRR